MRSDSLTSFQTMLNLLVNGERVRTDYAKDTPLLWFLRDQLDLTGTKYGCGIAQCGACTVLVDGKPARSCSVPIESVADYRDIVTVEGLKGRAAKAVQEAWVRHDVVQCGYCQSGQIVAATALVTAQLGKPVTDAQIDEALAGNLCRCATYQRIRAAVKDAAQSLVAEAPPPPAPPKATPPTPTKAAPRKRAESRPDNLIA